jgi:16S rRNA A1518/A1519 N6-dimethyltransferase RsmA/KsgA/DIM1 with predicted DNA glycosylase/AP lyase activity
VWNTNTAKLWLPSILNIYNFSKAGKIADLGGGEGYLLGMILAKYKNVTATLLDQKDVVAGAKCVLTEYGVYDRVTVMVGDFLKSDTLPKDHDTYILCRTLLNWSDEDCRTIINNCSEVMKSGSI